MTPTRIKDLTLASRLCLSRMALFSVLPQSHKERSSLGKGSRAQAGRLRIPATRGGRAVFRALSAGNARGTASCKQATYSAHARAARGGA